MKIPRVVYAIQHNKIKKIYIGSSTNVEKRYFQHINALRRGKHIVEDMQKDFDRYGEDYSLYILETINRYEDRFKEYEWMLKYKTNIREIGYNYKQPNNRVFNLKGAPFKEGLPKGIDKK